jgi:glycosyltransferase involved in cell wall biosynthesis
MLIVNCRFLSQKITGTQKFASEICKELIKQEKDIVFLSNPNILQKDIAKELNVKIIGHKSYKWFKLFKLPSGLLWEQLILPFYIKNNYPNAKLINLINLAPILYENNVVVLHDVAFKKYPEFFKKIFLLVYNTLVPIILKRAKKIFTVSEFSKSEIVEFFKVDDKKIDVIYNAVDNKIKFKIEEKKEKYILAVGSLEPRKNISKLIEVISNQEDLNLIIVGEQNSKVFNSNTDIKVSNNIKFTGYVDNNELEILYQYATAFIYPSLYEGFGIPPLEAQSFGIPAIVSDIPVFHEVYDDSVLYVNPYSSTDILEGIKKLMSDDTLQYSLIEKGYENIKKYSWDKSAKKLLKCLK